MRKTSNDHFLFLLGCKIMEDEIVHVLANDRDVGKIVIIDNGEITDFVEKIKNVGIVPEILPKETFWSRHEQNSYGTNQFNVVVLIQPKHLHSSPKKLKDTTYKTIKEQEAYVDSILLFYGSCGKAFNDLDNTFYGLDVNVHILGERKMSYTKQVTDCISAVVGGDEKYHSLLKQYPDALFFTPLWSSNWDILFGDIEKNIKSDMKKKKFFKMMGVKTLIKIDTGINYETEFDLKINQFAAKFDFKVKEISGTSAIIEQCYANVKDKILILEDK